MWIAVAQDVESDEFMASVGQNEELAIKSLKHGIWMDAVRLLIEAGQAIPREEDILEVVTCWGLACVMEVQEAGVIADYPKFHLG